MTDVSIPILLVGFGVLIVVLAAIVAARQLWVSRQTGLVECSVHRRSLMGGSGWQHGLMRFSPDRLRWFHGVSLRLSPSLTIARSDIADVERRQLDAQLEGDLTSYLVTFSLGSGGEVRAILDPSSAAALTAWLEAAPIGLVLGDTD